MNSKTNVSRRRFMRTAAAAATAPAVVAAVSARASSPYRDVLAAATVVRASISRNQPGTLQLGVRVSVLADEFRKENIVISVDGVQFHASADMARKMITEAVQKRVMHELATTGTTVSAESVAVQVFGGVL